MEILPIKQIKPQCLGGVKGRRGGRIMPSHHLHVLDAKVVTQQREERVWCRNTVTTAARANSELLKLELSADRGSQGENARRRRDSGGLLPSHGGLLKHTASAPHAAQNQHTEPHVPHPGPWVGDSTHPGYFTWLSHPGR